ncbi:thioredoxin-dependent thiol peroxidase [Conyzicola nivalis]|uniref:thioredoxin-dependent peroxiredoxin n=1 Tax=Conyzicola nivalis TaxID=1477021 RepID=A0A916SN64_9MICO|nr:redoxin domain-containing protein [Conyzicola nivalis]GGB05671.1 peroxiredoxin [Conyzicola nivalis]
MLTAGTAAPAFTLTDSAGRAVSLADFAGEWLVFWWYPEANSSGCSLQAAALDRAYDELGAAGVRIVGASFNSAGENGEFSEDAALRYPLLSDPERVAGTAYEVVREPGAPFEKKPFRYTYLIDPDGVIAHAEDANELPLGTYGEHMLEVVAAVRADRV